MISSLPFNLSSDVARFAYMHSSKQIAVFLHTSLLKESNIGILKLVTLKPKNVFYYLTENTVYELRLLAKYSHSENYRKKAKTMLDSFRTKNAWSLKSIIDYKNCFLDAYRADIALFVFLVPVSAQDFTVKMGKAENVYFMNCDPLNTLITFYSPALSGTRVVRKCTAIHHESTARPFAKTDTFVICDARLNKRQTVYGNDLKPFNNTGAEAILFTAESLPNKVLKIYKYPMENDKLTRKLQLMCFLNQGGYLSCCVLPSALIMRDGKCVGFVMDKSIGRELSDVIRCYNEVQKYGVIRDLTVSLLEMRFASILFTDISPHNIQISSGGALRILDCDSMEICQYPGGGITPPYGHPDVTEKYFYSLLRTMEQIDFSYAVMLFTILLWEQPLLQAGLGDVDVEWRVHQFPLANDTSGNGVTAANAKLGPGRLEAWKELPLSVRKNFVDVFNFMYTHDFGSWVKALDLIS